MLAAVMGLLLFAGAPPHWPNVDGDVSPLAEVHANACRPACPNAADQGNGCSRPLWGWVAPPSPTGHAPGTLRTPTYSWYKHTYLAFRGNYYLDGYDYRRQFDYPWHNTPSSSPPCCVIHRSMPPHIEPHKPQVEEIPTPPPQGATARHASDPPTLGPPHRAERNY
jgi:hypothetical protein